MANPESDLGSLADEGVAWLRKNGGGLEGEFYLYRGRDRGIELKEGEPETTQESSESGMGLRLFDGERIAFAFAGGLDPALFSQVFSRAAEQLPHLPSDPDKGLPVPPNNGPEGDKELLSSLDDPEVFSSDLAALIDPLREMESRARGKDPRITSVLQAGYGETRSEVAVASTLGVRCVETGTSCAAGLYAMAGEGDEVQVGSASRSSRRRSEIDLMRTADEAVFRTISLLEAKKLPGGRRAVLFDPWVAGEVLDLLAGPMSADAVQRGKSLLKGRMGQSIASEAVTFRDDPRRAGGISSAAFDDEGMPTHDKVMVDRGILKELFHDSYTARKDGIGSNGCAGRTGFRGLPGATSSNFYLEPGSCTRDELIADTKDGILVFEIMGMHTADPISGEMSVGVSGVAIKDGEIAHGIRGAMLSANLIDIFKSVDKVADDLVFYGSLAAPTFRAVDLQVS